jgi:hypothetical protein
MVPKSRSRNKRKDAKGGSGGSGSGGGSGGSASSRGKASGLTNRYGENNCFLNVVVQVLRVLNPFRQKLGAHRCDGRPGCLLCALASVFVAMEGRSSGSSGAPAGGRHRAVSLTALREALHETLLAQAKSGTFQRAAMGDAAEALEDVVKLLHAAEVSSSVPSRSHLLNLQDCPRDAFTLRTFGILVRDNAVCRTCAHVYGSVDDTMLALHVNARAVRDFVAAHPRATLEEAVREVSSVDARQCSVGLCRGPLSLRRTLLADVPVFSVSLGWSTVTPREEEVRAVVSLAQPYLDLNAVFHELHGTDGTRRLPCRLRAIVGFRENHYVALFDECPSATQMRWICCDDERVDELSSSGLDWCLAVGFVPQLLLYESLGVDGPMVRSGGLVVAPSTVAGGVPPAGDGSSGAPGVPSLSAQSFPALPSAASRSR